MNKLKLIDLKIGQKFSLPDGSKSGTLLFKNDCRAKVLLGKKAVSINGEERFAVEVVQDWSPYTEVIIKFEAKTKP